MKKILYLIIFCLFMMPHLALATTGTCIDGNEEYITFDELDSRYEYDWVNYCEIRYKLSNNDTDTVFYNYKTNNFKDLNRKFGSESFCGIPLNDAIGKCNIQTANGDVCYDEYEAFPINFVGADGIKYVGFGCRKEKEPNNVCDEKTVYVGDSIYYLGKETGIDETCTSSDLYGNRVVEWQDKSKCYAVFSNPGKAKINAYDTNGNLLKCTEYTVEIKKNIKSVSPEIDKKLYDYKKTSSCNNGEYLTYNGLEICSGYQKDNISVECSAGYNTINLDIEYSNNTSGVGYICRKPKLSQNPTTPSEPTEKNCKSLLGSPDVEGSPAYYLNKVFRILRYVAIILLIGLSVFDFITATASNDEKALNKAVSKTIKRAIICLVIFFLPILIKLLLQYLDFKSTNLCDIEK